MKDPTGLRGLGEFHKLRLVRTPRVKGKPHLSHREKAWGSQWITAQNYLFRSNLGTGHRGPLNKGFTLPFGRRGHRGVKSFLVAGISEGPPGIKVLLLSGRALGVGVFVRR